MKSFMALVLAAVGLLATTAHAAVDANYYQIKRIVIKELQDSDKAKYMDEKVGNFTEGCNAANTPNVTPIKPDVGNQNPLNPIDYIDVVVDKIINIGKKIWAIVDAGRPVVNVKVDTANALPAGVKCWDELEGWQAPTSKLYQVTYENGFGNPAITYAFRVSFISGGSYKGQGHFLTLATIQPAKIDVSWGFNFDAVATIPMVFNQGSKADPLAGMQLAMNWKIRSVLQELQQAENFFVNGTGTLQKLK
jgi:hypothetical protein